MEEAGTGEIAKVLGARSREFRVTGLVGSYRQRKENTCCLLIGTTKGLNHEEFRIIRRLHDPVALANSNERSGLA